MPFLYTKSKTWNMREKIEYKNKTRISCVQSIVDLEKIVNRSLKMILEKEDEQLVYGDEQTNIEAEVEQLLKESENYLNDLVLDIYMSFLWNDENNDVSYSGEIEEEWEKGSIHKSVNKDEVIRNYPFAEMCGFPAKPIQGGCREYHELMMKQKNIGIFDFSGKTKNMQRYGFPKTKELYQELQQAPIENMILLEQTQGVKYTNILFEYLHKIVNKENLEMYEQIIKGVLGIEPIFIRNEILRMIFGYVTENSNNENENVNVIKEVNEIIGGLVYFVNKRYRRMFKITWLACQKNKERLIEKFKNYLEQNWESDMWQHKSTVMIDSNEQERLLVELVHMDIMDNAYEIIIKSESMQDWVNIKTVEDCFNDASSILDADVAVIQCEDGETARFLARKAVNPLGEAIRKRAQEEKYSNSEMLIKDFYQKEAELFNKVKEAEESKLRSKELKSSVKTWTPMYVYAQIHQWTIEGLSMKWKK